MVQIKLVFIVIIVHKKYTRSESKRNNELNQATIEIDESRVWIP